jgi:hypothetical protein
MTKIRDPKILELFRKLGSKGGKARKRALTAAHRRESARRAARARWDKERAKRKGGRG